MRTRFTLLLCAALAATVSVAPQATAAGHPEVNKPEWVRPPARLPHVPHGDHSRLLDRLFAALKAAPDEETAKAVESRIWATWMVSPSDTAMLLMTRVRKAIEDKDKPLAIKLLDAIIKIKPDYVEAWNERATIYFGEKKFGRAIADLSQVLVREPRHFGALSGLGMILQEIGDDKGALEAYRRALAVYPRLEHVPDIVKKLSDKVEGQDI
jgi:tetratricopeptide (TPR) repeat protein